MDLFRALKAVGLLCLGYGVLFFDNSVSADNRCYHRMSEVLGCFFSYQDDIYRHAKIEEDYRSSDVTIKTYLLDSQKWPIGNYSDIPTTVWQHRLVLYIPKKVSYPTALLYVNGGRNRDQAGKELFLSSKEQMDYATIATNNQAVVVELQDVPNQYLFFSPESSGEAPFKEDEILAYTYKRFMDDPWQNAYLAGHLPMAKAILKGMDAVQAILNAEHQIKIDGFVLSGASKRGWAVWLAALGDRRVEAIVPVVIDALNTKKNLNHICESYGGRCPYALRDYEKYNITKCMATPQFEQLMQVEDPYSYLGNSKYQQRFEIPKYIINASGDNFFVPDSSRWYFKDLPQSKYIRYLPNAMHYLAGNAISDVMDNLSGISEALDAYFYLILNQDKVSLPQVEWLWSLGDSKIVFESKGDQQPFLVKLWVAENKSARDFRFISSVSYFNLLPKTWLSHFFKIWGGCCKKADIPWICSASSRETAISWIGNNHYQATVIPFECRDKTCKLSVNLPVCSHGWQASFVELHYKIAGKIFIITSEVNIVPDTLFVPNARKSVKVTQESFSEL